MTAHLALDVVGGLSCDGDSADDAELTFDLAAELACELGCAGAALAGREIAEDHEVLHATPFDGRCGGLDAHDGTEPTGTRRAGRGAGASARAALDLEDRDACLGAYGRRGVALGALQGADRGGIADASEGDGCGGADRRVRIAERTGERCDGAAVADASEGERSLYARAEVALIGEGPMERTNVLRRPEGGDDEHQRDERPGPSGGPTTNHETTVQPTQRRENGRVARASISVAVCAHRSHP